MHLHVRNSGIFEIKASGMRFYDYQSDDNLKFEDMYSESVCCFNYDNAAFENEKIPRSPDGHDSFRPYPFFKFDK